MAAVTQTRAPKYNVSGSVREQFYQITGVSGDTLNVGLQSVLQVDFEPTVSGIAGYSVAPAGNGQSTVTFTSGGPFANVDVTVRGN